MEYGYKMGFFDRFRGKQENNENIVTSVMNQTDMQPSYPDANYSSFSINGYAGNELVFACIREIATSSAEAMLCLYDSNGELVENNPLSNLLKSPTAHDTQYEFLEALITHLQIAGNAYVLKERAPAGVVSLMLLRPDRVEVYPQRNAYSYSVGGQKYFIPADDIGHLKFPNPNNDFYGLSPLQVLLKQTAIDTDATNFTRAFFNNAGVPSGMLKLKRRINSQEEADRLRTQWRGQFRGDRNWHRIAILDEDATYETMGSSIGQMEIPALRQLSESRICAAFGVPAILVGANVGLQRSTYSNYREARESFWEETLLPLYKRIEQFMAGLLMPEFPSEQGDIYFDFSNVRALQEDEDAIVNRKLVQAQIAKELINSGFTPQSALTAAGIDEDIDHTGYLPTSLTILGNSRETQIKEEREVIVNNIEPKKLSQSRANRLLEPLQENYEDEVVSMEKVLDKYFKEELNRADGVIGRYLNSDEVIVKSEDEVKFEAPSFISENAKRGLKYYKEGRGGDGLVQATIRDARTMAGGFISEGKVRKMSAWFARHITDLDASQNNNPNDDKYPGAGAVAWMLWGGNPTSKPMQAKEWADRKIAQMNEDEKAPVPGRDRFTTRDEALDRAEQIGCEGTHTMTEDGETIYMPCSTHEAYDNIVNPSGGSTYEKNKLNLPFNEFTIIPLVRDAELSTIMATSMLRAIRKSWNVINAGGLFVETPFDPQLPIIQNALRVSGKQINDVSRKALARTLQEGVARGYTIGQIVRGVPDEGYFGVRSIVRETYKNRSRAIARTEIANAQNTGTLARYQSAGVTRVTVRDGEEDALCAEYNGTVQTLDWALSNPTAHPNCTRAFAAVVEGIDY